MLFKSYDSFGWNPKDFEGWRFFSSGEFTIDPRRELPSQEEKPVENKKDDVPYIGEIWRGASGAVYKFVGKDTVVILCDKAVPKRIGSFHLCRYAYVSNSVLFEELDSYPEVEEENPEIKNPEIKNPEIKNPVRFERHTVYTFQYVDGFQISSPSPKGAGWVKECECNLDLWHEPVVDLSVHFECSSDEVTCWFREMLPVLVRNAAKCIKEVGYFRVVLPPPEKEVYQSLKNFPLLNGVFE